MHRADLEVDPLLKYWPEKMADMVHQRLKGPQLAVFYGLLVLETNIPFGFLIIGTLQRTVPPQLGEVLNLLPVASCN